MPALILLQFALVGLNLYLADQSEKEGRDPSFSYFAAGFCLCGGIFMIISTSLR